MHNRIFFIINRIAGGAGDRDLSQAIQFACGRAGLLPEINHTRYGGHAAELARQAVAQGFARVVAVGGDGTINEVADCLVHTGTVLGIVPTGSGNGLARHLRIAREPARALSLLQTGRTIRMDVLRINGRFSCNVSGIGFDGLVAGRFGQDGVRGLRNYVKIILGEFSHSREFRVTAKFEGRTLQEQVFMVAIANSSQFGNGAVIAPQASVCDGKADVCLVRKPAWQQVPGFIASLFTRQLGRSKLVRVLRTDSCSLEFEGPMSCHFDGEPGTLLEQVVIEIEPACLEVIVPSTGGPV